MTWANRIAVPLNYFPCVSFLVFNYLLLEFNLFDNWQLITDQFQLTDFYVSGFGTAFTTLKGVYSSSQYFCNSRFEVVEFFPVVFSDFLQNPEYTCKKSGYSDWYVCFQCLLLMNSVWLGCLLGNSFCTTDHFVRWLKTR